jgi:hypothetical protein
VSGTQLLKSDVVHDVLAVINYALGVN